MIQVRQKRQTYTLDYQQQDLPIERLPVKFQSLPKANSDEEDYSILTNSFLKKQEKAST